MYGANDDLLKAFADIDSYLFKYKKRFSEDPKYNADDNLHIGVMAQELKENPLTESAIVENDEGFLMVDTRQLTMTLCAIVANLSKKIIEIEERLNDKGVKENGSN